MIYQYTFDAEMVNCDSTPQNFHDLLDATESEEINFNKIWTRDNFVDCAGRANESTDFSTFGTDTYPILSPQIYVKEDVFDSAKDRIEEKIDKNLDPHKSNWDSDSVFALNQDSKKAHCTDGICYNRLIFTRPGQYVVTAVLLDPLVTACDLRYSFIVKVTDFENLFDQELQMVGILTSGFLLLLFIAYFLEPVMTHYYRKSMAAVARQSKAFKSQSKIGSAKRRTGTRISNSNN
jgi:hypothetical protein